MTRPITIFTTLAVLLLLACCGKEVREVHHSFEIQLSVEGASVSTKADLSGGVAAVNEEDKIVSAQVWAFISGASSSDLPLAYKSASGGTSSSLSVQLEFNDAALSAGRGKYLEFFVIANRLTSIGDGSSLTKGQVQSLTLDTPDFGTSDPVVGAVPASGLPMSMSMTSTEEIISAQGELSVTSQSITLRRAVSKIRFCVARKIGVNNVQILGYTINDQMIPALEYLMPDSDVRTAHIYGSSYSSGLSYSGRLETNTIPEQSSETLESLVYSTWAAAHPGAYAQDYDTAISQKTVEYGRTYLRESDKAISGTVLYSTDGGVTTVSAPFSLAAAGDFVRNHSVIVYLYFEELKLYAKPTVVTDWTKGDHLTFSTQGSTEFGVHSASYKLYDADGYPTDWNNAYVAVAYGLDSEGAPLYSPLLRLVTTSTYAIQLQCDNADFGFIVCTSGEGGGLVYSGVQESVTIPSNDGIQQTTDFYVVPTHLFNFASANPPGRTASISLIEATSETIGSLLPFNASVIPGNNDSTEGYFYYVTPSEYNSSTVEIDPNS